MFSFLRRKGLREARLQFCLRLRQGRLSLRAPGRAAGPVPAGGVAPRGQGGDGHRGLAVGEQDCQGGGQSPEDATDAGGDDGLAGAQAGLAEFEQVVDGGAMIREEIFTSLRRLFCIFSCFSLHRRKHTVLFSEVTLDEMGHRI